VLFPLVTTVFAIFLGWLRLTTGSVWAGSVAHVANNGIEDNLNRLTLTGSLGGTMTTSAGVTSLTAEAIVVLGIVATHRLGVRRHGAPESTAALTRSPGPEHANSLYVPNGTV
jgi:membrane protease YdiL (CAAX protease family)